MARTITTVTTTVKDTLPYHFTCNYCGCRNDKTSVITGAATGRREDLGGALLVLHGEPERYRQKIREYEERLRAGSTLPEGKFDTVAYYHTSLISLGLDGRCERCGREQAWAIDPDPGNSRWRAGCLAMLAFDLGGLALFLIGAIAVTNWTLQVILMVLGGLVFLGGMLGCLIVHLVRSKRSKKAAIQALRDAPNDPDKLPVIDVPEPGEWDMGRS